jgi:hypothetical protein
MVIVDAEIQRLPLSNVLPITLPLMRIEPAAVEDGPPGWRPKFATLPLP